MDSGWLWSRSMLHYEWVWPEEEADYIVNMNSWKAILSCCIAYWVSVWIYWVKYLHDTGNIKLEAEGAELLLLDPLDEVQERDVILERPPGGATILCAVRRGMWSSFWVPLRKRKKKKVETHCCVFSLDTIKLYAIEVDCNKSTYV